MHSPFHAVPQLVKRPEDSRKRPSFVMVKQSGYVFKEQIRRPSGLSQSGNLKEESSSGILKSPSFTCARKRLAWEASAKKLEIRHSSGVDFSCVSIVDLLLFYVVDSAVARVGIFVDLAVADAPEAARAVKSRAETSDAREHIKVSNQASSPPSSCSERKKSRTF